MLKQMLISAAFGLVLSACAMQQEQKAQVSPDSLYARLGGMPAIEAVVDEFTARMAADPRVNKGFAKTDIAKFKKNLADQICEATGGPCKYKGKDMVSAHKGMNITNEQFNITGGHLAAALDKFNVPLKEKNELLRAIGSMQKDIVGK